MHVSRSFRPAIRLPYTSQAKEVLPSLAKVMGGIEIGKGSVIAMRTMEMETISETKLTAPRAEFRAIGWVNPNNWYTSLCCLISDETLQLRERPTVVEIPLVFSCSCPLSNMSELFQCDTRFPFLCLFHDSLTYVVEHPGQDTIFPPANGFEPSSSRTGALCLELLSYPRVMSPYMFSLFTFEIKPCGAGCQVVPTYIHSDNPSRLNAFNFFFDSEAEIDLTIPHIQDNFGFFVSPTHILLVIVGKADRQVQSSLDSGNRGHIAFHFESRAVEMERIAIKANELSTSLGVAVNPANFAYRLTNQSCWKRTCCPDFSVSLMIEPVSVKGFVAESNFSNLIQGLSVDLKCAKQDESIIRSGDEFEFKRFPNQHDFILANGKEFCTTLLKEVL